MKIILFFCILSMPSIVFAKGLNNLLDYLDGFSFKHDGSVVYDTMSWNKSSMANSVIYSHRNTVDGPGSYVYNKNKVLIVKDHENKITNISQIVGDNSSTSIGFKAGEINSVTKCSYGESKRSGFGGLVQGLDKIKGQASKKIHQCQTITKNLCNQMLKISKSKNYEELSEKIIQCDSLVSFSKYDDKVKEEALKAQNENIRNITAFRGHRLHFTKESHNPLEAQMKKAPGPKNELNHSLFMLANSCSAFLGGKSITSHNLPSRPVRKKGMVQ